MTRRPCSWLLAIAALAAAPVPAGAHRLDEYLQATRVMVDVDRISVEIDLTAGVRVAAAVLRSIDADADGAISAAEADAYARRVFDDVTVSVDGRPAPLRLAGSVFPAVGDMMLGTGTIQLRAIARVPAVGAGSHQVTCANAHAPGTSVYLANALVPSDRRIQISAQRRDMEQRRLTIEYSVEPSAVVYRTSWLFAALMIAIGLAAVRRRIETRVGPAEAGHYPKRSASRQASDSPIPFAVR